MNKIDFLLIYDAKDANPNGDPDMGNMPRIDPETGQGIVTDVCLKRKIRNYVEMTRGELSNYKIYVKEKAILNKLHEGAHVEVRKEEKTASEKEKGKDPVESAKKWMCKTYFDVRTFGAVMSTGGKDSETDSSSEKKEKKNKYSCGQVRGPVQISFSRSVDPVVTCDYSITRCAVTKPEDAEKERTMGRKFTVPYGLYVAKGTINPFLAEQQTEFSEEDLQVLIEALQNLFTFDASAARPAGSMAVRKLILFHHDSKLGNAPAHKLFESLHIKRKEGVEVPRSYDDYIVELDPMPAGVQAEEIDC